MSGTYAQTTTVSPERSQAEIAETLRRYGAEGYLSGWQGTTAMIAFQAHGKQIRFTLDLPKREDRIWTLTETGRTRTPAAANAAYEQEVRRRWRALALVIKAKLEAVETGIVTFEAEFLAHIVLPGGRTIEEELIPKLEEALERGVMPTSLLPQIESGRG